jgi:hypothetical protein
MPQKKQKEKKKEIGRENIGDEDKRKVSCPHTTPPPPPRCKEKIAG